MKAVKMLGPYRPMLTYEETLCNLHIEDRRDFEMEEGLNSRLRKRDPSDEPPMELW